MLFESVTQMFVVRKEQGCVEHDTLVSANKETDPGFQASRTQRFHYTDIRKRMFISLHISNQFPFCAVTTECDESHPGDIRLDKLSFRT